MTFDKAILILYKLDKSMINNLFIDSKQKQEITQALDYAILALKTIQDGDYKL